MVRYSGNLSRKNMSAIAPPECDVQGAPCAQNPTNPTKMEVSNRGRGGQRLTVVIPLHGWSNNAATVLLY